MKYNGYRFEQHDKDREREYDKKHLADCKEVKTYKLSPEEIEARYGSCKGSGEYISPMLKVRNLTKREDDDDMAIHDRQETLEAVKKVMEQQNITEHIPGAATLAKYAKKYEQSIYHHFGGVAGLSEEIGLPVYADWKTAKRLEAKKLEQIEDVPEEEFEKVYVKAQPEPLVFTVKSEDKSEKCPLFAEYQKKVDECMGLEIEIIGLWNQREDKQAQLLKLENWLEGFEAAAKLAGVSLE